MLGKRGKRLGEIGAGVLADARDHVLALDQLEIGQRHGRRHRMPGIGEAVIELAAIRDELVRDPVADHHRRHRHISRCQALGQRHHVRLQFHRLTGEPLAGAPEPGDHLVGNEQDIVPAADLLNMLEIACRRHDHAACPLNRLGDEGGDVGGADLVNLVIKPAGRVGGELGLVLIALVKEAVRRPDMGKIRLVRSLFMHSRHAAHAGRHDRAAVIAEVTADDDPLFRLALERPVMTDHANDGVVRF